MKFAQVVAVEKPQRVMEGVLVQNSTNGLILAVETALVLSEVGLEDLASSILIEVVLSIGALDRDGGFS